MPPPPIISESPNIPPETLKALQVIEKQFELNDSKLKEIVNQFVKDFRYGLQNYGQDMAMVPTFVTGVPNGSEVG